MKEEEERKLESPAVEVVGLPVGHDSHNVLLDHAQQLMMVPLASLQADFLEEVGGFLHQRAVRRYSTPGPWRISVPISPFLARATFGSTTEICLDTNDSVAAYLGDRWGVRHFQSGSYARFIAPLHMKWVPKKRMASLQVLYHYTVHNASGIAQTDGRRYLPLTLVEIH